MERVEIGDTSEGEKAIIFANVRLLTEVAGLAALRLNEVLKLNKLLFSSIVVLPPLFW